MAETEPHRRGRGEILERPDPPRRRDGKLSPRRTPPRTRKVTVRVARVRSPGRTAASIRKGITSKLGAFRRCYRKLVGKRPRAGGEIELRFIVHTSGKVVSALVFRSTLGDPGAERCVRSVMRRVEVASIEEVTVARAVLVFRR